MRIAVFLGCSAAALALISGVARAELGEATPTAGGELSISLPMTGGSFAGALTGRARVLVADEADGGTPFGEFSVTDTRDSGTGWSVTVSATRFANLTYSGKDLTLGSLTMPPLAVESTDASSTAPPDTLQQATTVDTGDGGVVVAACTQHGQGVGTYVFSAVGGEPWRLDIAADAYAGVYVSTATITVATLVL